jgi:hypothetical protein
MDTDLRSSFGGAYHNSSVLGLLAVVKPSVPQLGTILVHEGRGRYENAH